MRTCSCECVIQVSELVCLFMSIFKTTKVSLKRNYEQDYWHIVRYGRLSVQWEPTVFHVAVCGDGKQR